MDYYRRRHRAMLQFATVRTSGMFRAENTSSDTRLASAEFSCYPDYGYDSFSEFESDTLPCRETYQYTNFDVASRLHPEVPDFIQQIDYQEHPPTENMYSERGNWRPYTNPRYDNWQPRRRSHLDDIYFPNYDTDDDFTGNRAGCSENTPIRIYKNYHPRGISVLHKVNNRLPWRRRKKRTRIINDNHKPNNTDGDKLIDKQLSGRVNSTANIMDVIETTQLDIVNDHKQSLEVKSVPCTTKSSDIEMSSIQSEATSSESGHQNVNVMETESEVVVGENNNSNAEKQLMSTTDNSSNNCSQEVYLADESMTCLLSNEFVDSRVLELNITSPIKENTESPEKQKLDTINYKQILSDLSGILQEDGQLKSNTDTNQTEMVDKSYAISGDDLLELLQSSNSCKTNSNSLMEGLDMKSNLNDCRRMDSKSSTNSPKISKIIDKPIQKDKIPKPENKANKNPYFPTLGNYSIPKLTASRKNEFSDTNELYLGRMHTLFGSDDSENESADECSSKTSKMKGLAKDKTVGPREKLSKCSIEKHKSKRKAESKPFKPSKRHSTELKQIDKRRHSLEITRSDLKVPSRNKLMDKHFTEKNEDRIFSKLPDEAKLLDKHSTKKNEGKRYKIPESDSKAPIHTKLTDKFPTEKNENIRSPESEFKTSNKISKGKNEAKQAKLVDKQCSAKNEDRKSNKATGPNDDRRSPKIQNSTLAKLVDKHFTGNIEDKRSPESMGRSEDRVSPKIPTSEATLLEKYSTGKDQDNCRTDNKIINSQEKMVYKRSHNPDPTSNKRRRTSAEEIMTDVKKTKTKIVMNETKRKSDNSTTNEKNQTNVTSDLIKAMVSEECKATKTDDVESPTHLDNKTEQISEVGSSNSSTVTHTEKDLTSLLKNGIVSTENVPFFHSSPLSPFQLPLRQTISQCSIVLNDCCDEAVTLERPDIQEIVQIIVNKSIKHITDGIIEILPNIPVIDLTDDGDGKETQLSGISEPELSGRSKDTTITIGTKQELLDILKEQSDKSLSPSEQITLYRSDETLNNSLEIQATSASISAAAVSSTGMVHPEVKQGRNLKVEDDSGVDMNESEEEGNKISSTATNNVSNNSRSTCIVDSPRPATATSEDNPNIVSSGSDVPNTSTTASQAIGSESHSLVTNSVQFPVNTRQLCILSTNSSVLSRNLTNSSRLQGDTFQPPPNKSVLDIPSSSQNTDSAIPIVELPALQAIGNMLQQADINGSGLQDASRNSIWRSRDRSPPPPYPGVTPRYVHTSSNSPVGQSTTSNAHCNIQPTHTSMETYKKDFNNLGALLVEYMLFFKKMRKAQSNYICNLKKECVTSPLLLANELCRFQNYYRDNMTYLCTSLKKAVQNLNLTSFMKVNDVPNFLNAIEVCLFQESSLASKTSVILWLHSLLAGSEDSNFWHGSLCCLYRYLETVVDKLRCRNQSGLPYSTDPFSLQQRNLLKNQIEEYNKICAKCILMHERTANLTTDLTGNESHQVSGQKRKCKTKSFQKIRLPLTVPYDVNVSTASISTSALSARTSVVSSKTTPMTGLTSISSVSTLNSQLMQLNYSAAAANSPVYPGTRNHPSRITNITTSPRADSSPVHTSSSLNYSIQAQEKLSTLLNCPMNSDMSNRNATATLNFPTHALSVVCSPAHQPVQQSNPSVYNSSAQSTPIRNSPLPISTVNNISARLTSTLKSPSRISSTLKSPAHIPAALNSPAHITAAFNSPGHIPAALNTNCSDNSHVFKPPQAQYRFRCASTRVQQTPVSMSPSQYSGQSSTIAQLNASGVQASPLRSLQDLVGPSSSSANSTAEKESLTLRNLLESGSSYRTPSDNSADPSTANDIREKSPVYAPMLFSPSNYQVDEVDNDDNTETIDLTWVDDVDADHLQMEIDYFIKKEEPSEENHVVLNQEQFPVTPSPTDSGIASPPVQGEINELYTNRTCICGNRAEYICGCRQAMYCSLPCQKQDWASHKAICLKYNAKNKEATTSGEQQ